jgi:hypothetical protein
MPCVLEVHLLDSSEGGPADGRHVCPPNDICALHDAMEREPDGKKRKKAKTQAIHLTASSKRLVINRTTNPGHVVFAYSCIKIQHLFRLAIVPSFLYLR